MRQLLDKRLVPVHHLLVLHPHGDTLRLGLLHILASLSELCFQLVHDTPLHRTLHHV